MKVLTSYIRASEYFQFSQAFAVIVQLLLRNREDEAITQMIVIGIIDELEFCLEYLTSGYVFIYYVVKLIKKFPLFRKLIA